MLAAPDPLLVARAPKPLVAEAKGAVGPAPTFSVTVTAPEVVLIMELVIMPSTAVTLLVQAPASAAVPNTRKV